MNLKVELTEKNQKLLNEIGLKVENREYSKEEIKRFINSIGEYIFSQSTKNGDLSKATARFNNLMQILIKNER